MIKGKRITYGNQPHEMKYTNKFESQLGKKYLILKKSKQRGRCELNAKQGQVMAFTQEINKSKQVGAN